MIELLGPTVTAMLDLLAPDLCPLCDTPAKPNLGGWCEPCMEGLPWLDSSSCAVCGDILGTGLECPTCLAGGQAWTGILAAVDYGGELRDLLTRWKFVPATSLSRPLSTALLTSVGPRLSTWDLVVPVPQREAAWRARGFHPAGDLASAVARHIKAPVGQPLTCSRGVQPQVGLTAAQRRRNVERLFRTRPAARRLAGKRILLVDDVVTTTATAAACSGILRAAGARSVSVVALARAAP